MKMMWARIGTTFEVPDDKYEELKNAITKDNSVKVAEILYGCNHYLDGNDYLPCDICDNPNDDDFDF